MLADPVSCQVRLTSYLKLSGRPLVAAVDFCFKWTRSLFVVVQLLSVDTVEIC